MLKCQPKGPVLWGIETKGNNNCTMFVWQNSNQHRGGQGANQTGRKTPLCSISSRVCSTDHYLPGVELENNFVYANIRQIVPAVIILPLFI